MKTVLKRALTCALFTALAATGTGLAFSVTTETAMAASRTNFTATLSAPLAQSRQEIINGLLWRCEGQTCWAPDDGSRPVTTCRRVAKEFGEVARFAAGRGELDGKGLASCNAA